MFDELRSRSGTEVDIEKIQNGYIISHSKGRIHAKTFNGLIRLLSKILDDRFIYDKETESSIINNN